MYCTATTREEQGAYDKQYDVELCAPAVHPYVVGLGDQRQHRVYGLGVYAGVSGHGVLYRLVHITVGSVDVTFAVQKLSKLVE